jgi:dienelactone hydrolase
MTVKKLFGLVVAGIFLCAGIGTASGKVITKEHSYSYNGTEFQGYMARPADTDLQRPGVLVVHQWKGLTGYERKRARMLAELGYVAFAGDIYGADTRPATDHEAALASKTFRENRALYRRRVRAALNQLRSLNYVDGTNLGAIGYCFGGTGVLELARSGADVEAVVSFHGGLSNPNPQDAKNIQAIVQVHHGAKDPYVSQKSVVSFWNEMKKANPDWTLNVYSDAVHSFTEKKAGDDPSSGSAYNARADRLSWTAMKRLFRNELQ